MHRILTTVVATTVFSLALLTPPVGAQGVPSPSFQQPFNSNLNSTFSILVMNAKLAGESENIFPHNEIDDSFSRVQTLFWQSSYQQVTLVWEIVDVDLQAQQAYKVAMPPLAEVTDMGLAFKDALDDARAQGYTLEDYDAHCLLSNVKDPPSGGNGFAGLKFSSRILNFETLAMELIHSHNVPHSTGFRDESQRPCYWDFSSHQGIDATYGNPFDAMGNAISWGEDSDPNVRFKNYLGWLPDSNIVDVTTSGVYTIYQQDYNFMPPAGLPVALRIHKDGQKDYWLEFRQRISGLPADCAALVTNVGNGALVYLGDKGWRYQGVGAFPYKGARLLDMHNGTFIPNQCKTMWNWQKFDWIDAALELTETFCDREIGAFPDEIRIRPTSITTPQLGPAFLKLRITVPQNSPAWQPKSNSRSLISFLEPPTTVQTYPLGPVELRATVTDADVVSTVQFELYRSWDESPYMIDTAPTQTGTEWKATFSGLAEGGYFAIVEATDMTGREETFGTFFMVGSTP